VTGVGGETYVVSAYLSPPALRGLITHRHDQCVALWKVDDSVITLARYWEIERLSGLKHHEMPLYDAGRSPDELLDQLLAREGVRRDSVTEIWGTPGLRGATPLPKLDSHGLPIHSLAHLFSGLCLDSARLRDSTIVALAIDGGPDCTLEPGTLGDKWYAGALARQGEVTLIPVESPGMLWAAAEQHFRQEPGTLMALAQASPVAIDYDLSVLTSERYWGGHQLMGRCHALVGALTDRARDEISSGYGYAGCEFTREELVASAVMKIVQAASIAIVKRNVDMLLDQGGIRADEAYLSLSGGYALNCPTNSRLVSAYGFRGLLAPPCANDSGQALGLGMLGFFARGDLRTRELVTRLPYAGENRLRIKDAVARWKDWIVDVQDFDEDVFVGDVRRHPVAWVDGAAEVGPRALGHRSILGDPTRSETKQVMNRIKQRQWWRPVAPIVLEDHVSEWFVGGRPSPFMLETFPVAPEYQPLVPAIMHLDGTARIQTLSAADEPFLAWAISAFHAATGVPVVCNTSLNDRGEPIVNDAGEALNFCVRKGIEIAYIGRRRFQLDVARASAPDEPERRPLAGLYEGQDLRPPQLFGPDAVEPEVLLLLLIWPALHRFVGVPGGDERLGSIVRRICKEDPSFQERAERLIVFRQAVLEGRKATDGRILI
jgi:carbamoyltransferase